MKYELLVDGRRRARVQGDDAVREWLVRYREEHVEDDPDAVHVQVRELTRFAWLTGGRLLDREPFLRGPPRTIAGRLDAQQRRDSGAK